MSEPMEPRARLARMFYGFRLSQAISVAAALGVADHLAAGSRGVEDLAQQTMTHAPTLYRLMRALAAEGVFEELPERHFALTPLSEVLRRDHPASIAATAAHFGRPYFWDTWAHLLHSVRTGETAFSALHGIDVWEFRSQHPEENAGFNAAMTDGSRAGTAALVKAYDFSRFARVADIAGGRGATLAAVLQGFPNVRGVLFDQPHVVADASALLAEAGVADRCEIVSGSFFDAVPDADAYVLRHILHDWDDDRSIAILHTIRKACARDARLLVVEPLIAPPNEGPVAKFMDLNMLVVPGGQERTQEEFAALFKSAAFELVDVYPAGDLYLIEGVPA